MLSLLGVQYIPPTCVGTHEHIQYVLADEQAFLQGKAEELLVAYLLFHTVRCPGIQPF